VEPGCRLFYRFFNRSPVSSATPSSTWCGRARIPLGLSVRFFASSGPFPFYMFFFFTSPTTPLVGLSCGLRFCPASFAKALFPPFFFQCQSTRQCCCFFCHPCRVHAAFCLRFFFLPIPSSDSGVCCFGESTFFPVISFLPTRAFPRLSRSAPFFSRDITCPLPLPFFFHP